VVLCLVVYEALMLLKEAHTSSGLLSETAMTHQRPRRRARNHCVRLGDTPYVTETLWEVLQVPPRRKLHYQRGVSGLHVSQVGSAVPRMWMLRWIHMLLDPQDPLARTSAHLA